MLFHTAVNLSWLSVFLDEPIAAAGATDKDVPGRTRRNRVRVHSGVENIHRCPRPSAANALANAPAVALPGVPAPGDPEIAVRIGRNTARLTGIVRRELEIIRCRPCVAAVGALAHNPVTRSHAFVHVVGITD